MIGSENATGAGSRGPDLNFHNKAPIKTMSDFKLRAGARPIRRMDVSDAASITSTQAVKKAAFSQESQALALATNRNLPPHLLLASLLEELCYIYVKDRSKAQHLFKILCERLIELQVMAPLSHLDEVSGLRYQRRTMLNKIIRAAIKSMDQGPSLLALTDANISLNLDGPSFKDEDIIEQQTSRYKNEFQELGLLGKGGFGSVFKARNYLDGREYAVKKVRFKHKNTDLELKLLREVKALANLQHTNIVGYNAAWMEYDNPYFVSKEKSPIETSKTQDIDSDYSDSVQSENEDSMSIEFCLTDDKSQSNGKESPNRHNLGGFGLAVSAKLFSTVHKQDQVILSGNNHKSSSLTHLSESHFSSTSREITHRDGFFQKRLHESVAAMNKSPSHDTDYFKSAFEDNQREDDVVANFEENYTQSTETNIDISTKTLFVNPSINYQSVSDHQIPCKTYDNQGISECYNSGDGLSVHTKMDSAGCVLSKESSDTLTSVVVDDQINVTYKCQTHHSHNNTCHTAASEIQNCPGHYPIINLPENFTYLSQRAAASHFTGPDSDHINHDNVLISTSSTSPAASQKLKLNSHLPVAQFHNMLDDSSQLSNDSSQLFDNSSKLLGNSSQLLGNSSKLFDNSSQLFDNSSQLLGNSSKLFDNSSKLLGNSSKLLGNSSKLFDNSSKLLNNSSKLFDTSSQLSDNSSQLPIIPLGLSPHLPSSLLLLDNQNKPSRYNEPSSPPGSTRLLQAPGRTPPSLVSDLNTNKTDTSVKDSKPFSWNFMRNNALSPIISVGQPLNRQRKRNPAVKMVLQEASISGDTFLQNSSFNVDSASAESGHRQTVLKKSSSLFERRSKKLVDEALETHFHSNVFHNSITLYIQMELCTFTLQEWMFERNTEFQLKGYDDTVMRLGNIRIFLQTLQGVDFIHTNGLIHRDLKPRNIFLSGSDLHVKIGDFGLATGDVLKPGREDLVLASLLSTATPLVIDNHTTGVGTSAYASPEQLKGSNYDFKSDMYSLGVMLYEMFHVFSTEMERVQEIQKLRGENKCCVTFRRKWPLEADTIEALTNPVACNRPSAQDVLSSQLFLSHEQQVKLLQRKVLQQQKEMERLQKEILEKDKIIAHLRRENRDLTMADEFNLFN